MQCPQCNHNNPEGVKFCGECGAKLEHLCPSCGSSNPPANKFCHQCGQRLAEPAVATPAPAPAAADYHSRLATYTPKHLTDKVLTTRSALEGERRQVTVLFADTAGFTALAEKLDPEDVHQILDRCFKLVTAALLRSRIRVSGLSPSIS